MIEVLKIIRNYYDAGAWVKLNFNSVSSGAYSRQ